MLKRALSLPCTTKGSRSCFHAESQVSITRMRRAKFVCFWCFLTLDNIGKGTGEGVLYVGKIGLEVGQVVLGLGGEYRGLGGSGLWIIGVLEVGGCEYLFKQIATWLFGAKCWL